MVGKVAASTQNQAKSALLFLYKEVLEAELPWLDDIETVKTPKRLPVVLTEQEVRAVLNRLDGASGLMLRLIYGSGMRIMECLRLRVKDVEFTRCELIIRDGKGAKDRITMLPQALVPALQDHLARVRALHEADLAEGHGDVYLPFALSCKYPNAEREWGWQYVFPSARRSSDPRSGIVRRHHSDEKALQRAMRQAVAKPATPHAAPFLRNPFIGGWLRHPHRSGVAGAH
ncbi:MAG: integron integrase [Telluria sp.]